MKNVSKILVGYCIMLSACSTTLKQVNSSDLKDELMTNESEANIITSKSIGQASLGMTLGELKQIVNLDTKLQPESEFMVDVITIAVTKGEEIEYYLAFPSSEDITDNSIITYLITQNPQYQTKEGVKVEMTIAQAEAVYGKVSLAYNIENESREYLSFPETGLKNIKFRPNNFELGGFASIYVEQKGYNQTENYREDAKVFSIEVVCPPIDCPRF